MLTVEALRVFGRWRAACIVRPRRCRSSEAKDEGSCTSSSHAEFGSASAEINSVCQAFHRKYTVHSQDFNTPDTIRPDDAFMRHLRAK
jgi:hypothetical protein